MHVTEAWNGGISTYVNTLLRHQAAAGHQVSLVYSTNQTNADFNEAELQSLGINLHPYQSSRNPLHLLRISRNIAKIIRSSGPDVVHLHSTFPGVYGRIFKIAPVVYCAHGWSFVQEEGILKRSIYWSIEKLLATRTHAIINISNHEQQASRSLTSGIPCPVIYTGIAEPAKATEALQLKLDDTRTNALYIGRLDYKKGFDILEAILNKPAKGPVHLSVIGQPRREGQGVDMKDSTNITYLGWVDNTQIDAYIQHFDVVIVPSRHEGFGLVVAEAMRNGKPAIVSRAGGLPELVTHGTDGFIFNQENAEAELTEIFANTSKQKWAAMGKAARQTYQKKFTVDRFVKEVEAVYSSVL